MESLEQQLASLSPEQRRLLERWLRQEQAEASTEPQSSRIPRRPSNGAAPLSYAQQRLWFLSRLEPGNPAYNVRIAVRLSGRLDLATLERSLNEIGCRHEVLRTTFAEAKGQPIQLIAPSLSIPLPLVELGSLSADERDSRVEQLALAAIDQPFDLERGPLLRASVLHLGTEEYVLLLILHHTIADAWSQGVLLGELAALYSAFLEGKPSPLAELPIQYADFAVWQREWLQGQALEEQLEYWKHQLKHAPHVLELPTDRPHPPTSTHRGAVYHFRLAAPLAEKLNGLCRREGVTLFMTLLAAFNVLLHRYTEQTDLVVGSPIAGRNRDELEGLIGCFINMLVLRTNLAGNPPFTAVLKQVRDVTLGAYAHQDLPFEKLVEALQPARDLSRHPLFQVVFNFQNTPSPALKRPGLTITLLELGSRTSRFDLAVFLRETDQAIEGRLEYSTDLFEAASIQRLVQHFETLLEGILAQPQQRLAELPLLTDAERQQLLIDWNSTTGHRPERCIHEQFEAQAARAPDAVALVLDETKDERRKTKADGSDSSFVVRPSSIVQLTYAELNQRANRLAHLLRSSGVRPESRVAICVERSLDLIVGILATLKAGGAYVPLDPAYPAERLALMLEDSQARVLITTKDDGPWTMDDGLQSDTAIVSGLSSIVYLDADWPAIARQPALAPASGATPDNLAYIIYTSGSTGRPKGVLVSHANTMRLFAATQEWFDFTETDVWSLFHSCAFDFSVWELWGALLYGGRLVVVPYWVSRAPDAFYELLDTQQVTVLNQTPSAFRQLIRAEETADLARCLRLRLVIFGGEALELQTLKPWLERHGDRSPRLVNMYGITETTVHVSYRPISLVDLSGGAKSPIGRRIPDLQVYLLNQQLQPAPIGALAELYIGGAGLARGYLNRPDLTAERFVPNPFAEVSGARYRVSGAESSDTRYLTPDTRLYKTGDLGFYRPDGDIEYVRRTDQQIKLRGYRIELGEIEAVLRQHADVRECIVVARADVPGDTRLVAYVVTADADRTDTIYRVRTTDGVPTPDPRPLIPDLRAFLQTHLPDYMVPAAFVVLEALPLTVQGKVDRRALPLPDHSDAVPGNGFIPARDTLELSLLQIWEEVLATHPIGIRDNFLDLGGHSLLAVSLLSRIQQLTDRRLPLAMIFQAPTVEQQAALLRQTAPPVWSALVPLQPSGTAPPFFCVHPAGGNITGFAQLARHLGEDQPFYGLQAPGLDSPMVPFTEIEPLAAYYVEELRRIQPEGPYLLGGWSMGGTVAFEMAQQLRQHGQIVALLALFDTSAKRLDEHRPYPAPLIDMFAQDLGRRLNKELPLLASILDPSDVDRQLGWILDEAQRENLLPMSVGLPELRQLFEVFAANMHARDSYMPQVYPDRVALFRASESLRNRPIGMDLGWRALVREGLTIQIVPGDHYTMLQEPQVQILAQRLKTCIDESLNPRAHDRAAETSEQAAITLLNRVEDQKIDTLLRQIVGRFVAAFPSRIRACYLTGSYAMGGAVPDSDIDVIMVFTGSTIEDEEQEQARDVYQSCSLLCTADLSIDIVPEAELISHTSIFKTMTVKMAATLIYGEDIRDAISMPPADLYTRATMDAAFFHTAQVPLVPFPILSRLRRVGGSVVFPLDYPDPAGEFYGYDLYRGADGSVSVGTKALVKLTRDMARAIVARTAGPYTTVTSEYATTYRECVGDEWAGLLEDIYETCKQQWRYDIPTDAQDRQKLRELCRRALGFENHFLAMYRDHLLNELESAEEEHIIHAVEKLGESVYPDDQIIARLQKLAAESDTKLAAAIEKTKKRIVKACAQRGIPDADPASCTLAPVDSSRWMAYAGMYRGDSLIGPISASIHVGDGLLWAYVPALAAKIPCSPFDDRSFDCIYGFIEFQETQGDAPQTMTVDIIGGSMTGGTITLWKESR